MNSAAEAAWTVDGDATPEGWTPEIRAALRSLYQGALVEEPPITYYADPRYPLTDTTRRWAEGRSAPGPVSSSKRRPPWGIVTTQTCDLIEEGEPKRPWFSVAPVYLFACHRGQAESIRRGEQFCYFYPVTALPGSASGIWVADLRLQVPIEKGWLVGRRVGRAFISQWEYASFAQRIADLATRFAYPRRLQERFLSPVQAKLEVLEQRHAGAAGICEVRYHCGRDQTDPDTVQLVLLSDEGVPDRIRDELIDWWVEEFQQGGPMDGLVVLEPRFLTFTGDTGIDPREYEELHTINWPAAEAGEQLLAGPSP